MGRPVVISLRAEGHVAAIYAYIATRSGEARADLVTDRLLAVCEGLEHFPERGTRRDDIHPGLRVMGYRRQATIAFVVEPTRVVIHAILGRGQDIERLFDEDAGEAEAQG
jgi:toxin ParE1/3/4